jgi:hypothetical protein
VITERRRAAELAPPDEAPAGWTADGRLVLTARGARMVAVALRLAARAAARNGVDYRARPAAGQFAALLAMADRAAAAAAPVAVPGNDRDGTGPPGRSWLATTRQAADVLGVSPRTVRWRVQRGLLAGRRAGHAWLVVLNDDDGRRGCPASPRKTSGGRTTPRRARR